MMKRLAPDIYRQRLIVEGEYAATIEHSGFLHDYLVGLSERLKVTIVYGPVVVRAAEKKDPKYAGYEGHVIWAESGASVYTWESHGFFTVDIYSCAPFSAKEVAKFTSRFFIARRMTYRSM